ncbi:MAG TPA: alpha/beta fold hydrolase [Bacteroidales bacterium]|nr:alpha/beta fold hydrolase [Bacteroidales bacterium]HQK37617.1 alpha/beta fold hydrolase [Bacteroidales bacterium]
MSPLKLFFRETGTGIPLVILHGLYGMSDNWLSVAKELGKHFRVILPDMRNHGRSPHDPEHTYQAMREDISLLFDDLKLNNAILLGHSMGGKTAMFFAARYPEKLSRLIVVDIAPGDLRNTPRGKMHELQHRVIIDALLKLDTEHLQSRQEADRALSASIVSLPVRQFLLKNLHRRADGSFTWLVNLKTLSDNLSAILEGLHSGKDPQEKYPVEIPALFIKGELSHYILPEDEEEIRNLFPYSEVTVIQGAGHWVHAEQPEQFLAAVASFLSIRH